MAQRRRWCWKQSWVWLLPGSFGECPACPSQGAEGGRHQPKTVFMARRQRRGSCPVHRKAIIKIFQWAEWAKPQILMFNPSLCIWNFLLCQPLHSCASITQWVPATPSRSQNVPAFPVGIRDAQECFKQRLFTVLVTSNSLSGYLHRLLAVVLTLVKTAVLGIS